MFRVSTYSVDEVFTAMDLAEKGKYAKLPDNKKFKPKSHRLVLFKTKGVHCVECGIEGTLFALESHREEISPHHNLYGIDGYDDNGDIIEVLMTKDHIHPRAKGGKNVMENYQTMCAPCNVKKADTLA